MLPAAGAVALVVAELTDVLAIGPSAPGGRAAGLGAGRGVVCVVELQAVEPLPLVLACPYWLLRWPALACGDQAATAGAAPGLHCVRRAGHSCGGRAAAPRRRRQAAELPAGRYCLQLVQWPWWRPSSRPCWQWRAGLVAVELLPVALHWSARLSVELLRWLVVVRLPPLALRQLGTVRPQLSTLRAMRPADRCLHAGATAAGLRAARGLHYTAAAPANLGRGLGSPTKRRSSRAGFPFAAFLLRSASRFNGGTCGEGRKPLPVPLAGLPTPHVLPPMLGSLGGRFQTCPRGAIYG